MGRAHHGELWGVVNMFKENAERGVQAHEILTDGKAAAQFRIQACDPGLLGARTPHPTGEV
jgi:hypothetical protein